MIHDRVPPRRKLWLAPLAVALLGVSCSKAPRTHYYDLRLPSKPETIATGPSAGAPAIGVTAFRVDPPYDGDRIVYRIGEQSPEIAFYAYHRWAAPLSRMLSSVTADALRGTAGLASIEPVAPGLRYDATLHGRLLVLEEIDLTQGQIVRVRLELTLQRADGTVAWTAKFAEDGKTDTDRVSDIVDEMQAAIGRALSRASDGLGEAARGIALSDS